MNRVLRPIAVLTSTAACLLTAALLSGCIGTQDTAAVPEAIKARPGERVAMVVPAKGVQIYECKAKAGQAGAYEWAFVAPDAELLTAAVPGSARTMPGRSGNRAMAARSRVR